VSHLNLFHTFTLCFCKIYFNIILPSTSRYPQCSPHFRCVCISHPLLALCAANLILYTFMTESEHWIKKNKNICRIVCSSENKEFISINGCGTTGWDPKMHICGRGWNIYELNGRIHFYR
jgi:hypothetical protein